jgi:glycosyltransferase involved in cell wall biosynthesis
MRIGIDGLPLSERKTGVGHYTFELARALALDSPSDEFELVSPRPFMSLADGANDLPWPSNLRAVHQPTGPLSRRWFLFGLPRYISQRPLSLFHGTNYEVPLWKSCPTVLTIHDLSLLLYPETHEPKRVRRARRRLPIMTRAADLIVTPTNAVRLEVCEYLKVTSERVVAVPEAPRRIFRRKSTAETLEARERLGLKDDFLLFVGTLEPRKNLATLVEAYVEVLRATGSRLQLVIAGQKGWLTDSLFAQVERAGLADRIVFTGYLSDEDLCALYSSCRAFVYSSFYEGFGLPPLEAMACGAACIASRIPSIEEVVRDAALLFEPKSTTALSRSIISLLRDEALRQRLSVSAVQRAGEFSWERTARLMREVYAEAHARGARRV